METILKKLSNAPTEESDGKTPVSLTPEEMEVFTSHLAERCETLFQENESLKKVNKELIERIKKLEGKEEANASERSGDANASERSDELERAEKEYRESKYYQKN